MDVLLVLVVVAVAIFLITGPLRAKDRPNGTERQESPARADLEAAKEAKYREIRDAELDFRTGKLSRDDWQRLDSTLRADAVELLHRLDALEAGENELESGDK